MEMRLLGGMPIYIENIGYIYPLTLKEICNIGLTPYNQFISLLCIESNMLNSYMNDMASFDALMEICRNNKEIKMVIGQSINIFLKKDIFVDASNNQILIGENLTNLLSNKKFSEISILNSTNYEDFKYIIKLQNGLINPNNEEDDFNPSDAKAKQIIEKMKKARQTINKQQGNSEHENLNLIDLISILASNSDSLNILNIWDLTLYQFNDQFARMKILDEYNVNIRYLLAGAKSEDVNLKHWLCKINNN
jgi:hypothetical protein